MVPLSEFCPALKSDLIHVDNKRNVALLTQISNFNLTDKPSDVRRHLCLCVFVRDENALEGER